jgi:hypothetical protein
MKHVLAIGGWLIFGYFIVCGAIGKYPPSGFVTLLREKELYVPILTAALIALGLMLIWLWVEMKALARLIARRDEALRETTRLEAELQKRSIP